MQSKVAWQVQNTKAKLNSSEYGSPFLLDDHVSTQEPLLLTR